MAPHVILHCTIAYALKTKRLSKTSPFVGFVTTIFLFALAKDSPYVPVNTNKGVKTMSKHSAIKLDDPPTAQQIDELVRWARRERSVEVRRLFKQSGKWLASRLSALTSHGAPRQVH